MQRRDAVTRPVERLVFGLTALIVSVTLALFVAPLSDDANEAIFGAALLACFLILVGSEVFAVRRTTGIDRGTWLALLSADLILFVLFSIDSTTESYLPTREGLPVAFLLGPFGALLGVIALVVFARGIVGSTSTVALVADAAWLSVAALIILWPNVGDPVLHIGADRVTTAIILLQTIVASVLAGTLAALVLRTQPGMRRRTLDTGVGMVALRASSAIFYWEWLGDGIDRGGVSDALALLCIAAMIWTALRAPRQAPGLRGTNPSLRALLAVSWIPILFIGFSVALQSLEFNGHGVALIATCSLILVARLSVELFQSGRLRDELHEMATTDAMTQLPNRRSLEKHIAAAGESMTAVMIVDLDRFKAVNDQLGMDVGDRLLGQVAKRLREQLDDSWVLARAGGDEFVAFSTNAIDQKEVRELGNRIVNALTPSFHVRGREAWIGASIGAATRDDGIESHELRAVADLALRQAKRAGRGEVVVSDSGLRRRAGDAVELADGLRRAIDEDQFFCLYQPKVDLLTGEVAGVEALVRWRHPTRGVLAPGEFLDVAEAIGLIARIDQQVLRSTVSQLGHWNEEFGNRDLVVSVNMSAWQLARQDVAGDIAAALVSGTPAIEPRQIVVEISESLLVDDPLVIGRRLDRLRSTGVTVSVDDFGAGFTSVAHLRQFPISEVKIDRTLVAELSRSEANSRSVAGAVIALAQALKLDVIAEGVETRDQAVALANLGCRVAQGYVFARPVPAERISELVAAGAPFAHLVSPLTGAASGRQAQLGVSAR